MRHSSGEGAGTRAPSDQRSIRSTLERLYIVYWVDSKSGTQISPWNLDFETGVLPTFGFFYAPDGFDVWGPMFTDVEPKVEPY